MRSAAATPSTRPGVDPYDLDLEGLEELMAELDEPAYRARQLRTWLVKGVDEPSRMTDLPAGLRPRLAGRFRRARPELVDHRVADDGRTHKLLLELADEAAVETVVMVYPDRATVCVSSQVGCALGCPFCATGQAGLSRQLTAGEIVRQVVLADAALRRGALGDRELPGRGPDHVTNVVYMGMGEPLANLEATLASLRWLHDPEGFGLSARRITVSTVGLVPGIRRLAEEGLPVTLAVSLHAADDELRDRLVPINRVHPLDAVEEAARDYRDRTGRRISLEWCLIGGVNDRDRDADGLAAVARRLRAHVNVIPMNPTPGVTWREPGPERTRAFMVRLEDRGVNATLRDTRGRDAEAACGQLRGSGTGARLPVAVGAAERVEQARPAVADRGAP